MDRCSYRAQPSEALRQGTSKDPYVDPNHAMMPKDSWRFVFPRANIGTIPLGLDRVLPARDSVSHAGFPFPSVLRTRPLDLPTGDSSERDRVARCALRQPRSSVTRDAVPHPSTSRCTQDLLLPSPLRNPTTPSKTGVHLRDRVPSSHTPSRPRCTPPSPAVSRTRTEGASARIPGAFLFGERVLVPRTRSWNVRGSTTQQASSGRLRFRVHLVGAPTTLASRARFRKKDTSQDRIVRDPLRRLFFASWSSSSLFRDARSFGGRRDASKRERDGFEARFERRFNWKEDGWIVSNPRIVGSREDARSRMLVRCGFHRRSQVERNRSCLEDLVVLGTKRIEYGVGNEDFRKRNSVCVG